MNSKSIIVVFNFGEEAAQIPLPPGAAENLLTGEACAPTVSIPARDFVWLKQEV
ncbi:MAG: Beta-galactosidase C-terminal domain [Faecousia sp.]